MVTIWKFCYCTVKFFFFVFFSTNSDKDESHRNYNSNSKITIPLANKDPYEFTSEWFLSPNIANSIDTHEEIGGNFLLNVTQHGHCYHPKSSISSYCNGYDLENHVSHIDSYPYSDNMIRHHSLQTSHLHHHHHIETPFSKLLSISMKT